MPGPGPTNARLASCARALAACAFLALFHSAHAKRSGHWQEDPLTVQNQPDLAHMPVRGQPLVVGVSAPAPTPAPPGPQNLSKAQEALALGEVVALLDAYRAAGVAHSQGLVGPQAKEFGLGFKAKVEGSLDAAAALAKLKATALSDAAKCKVGWDGALASARLSNATTVIAPGDPGYIAARTFVQVANEPYNFQLPAAVVYAGSEPDVAAALKAAVDAGCRVCARAGGHDTSGASSCSGGVLIDVTRLKSLTLHGTTSATIQAGVRFGQMEEVFGPAGVGSVTGLCPDVGLAGYSLGGGWGVLSKQHGFGCDNVIAYTVALPDGRLVVADDSGPHADLFWALRGAGHGNFGIVTSIEYRIFPVSTYTTASITWPLLPSNRETLIEALDVWENQFLNDADLTTSIFPNFGTVTATGQPGMVFFVTSQLSAADLEQYLAPFVGLGGELSVASDQPWTSLTDLTDGVSVPPLEDNYAGAPTWEYKLGAIVERNLNKQEWGCVVDGMLTPRPTKAPLFLAYLEPYEGAMTSGNPNATAFVHRKVGFDIVYDIFGYPGEKGGSAAAITFLNRLYASPKFFGAVSSGYNYQNYPNPFLLQPQSRALDAFYGDNVCALVNVKRKYDPRNVFATEFGVPPHLKGC